MYIKRLDFDVSIKNLPASKAVRLKNDKMTTAIFRHIETAYMMAASDEDRKLVSELIDRINAAIHKTKTIFNSSGKKPKDPKDPKQPKDPKKPGGGDDIHVPSEPPKKPDDAEQPTPKPGGSEGGGDDIQLPEEPPKKPDGQ